MKKRCKECDDEIPWRWRNSEFCSRECKAVHEERSKAYEETFRPLSGKPEFNNKTGEWE